MKPNSMLLLAVALIATSCAPSSSVSVDAEVGRAIYNTMGLGGGTTSPLEYRLKVTVRNTGSRALVWDPINADFYPEHGRRLTQSTFPYDPSKGEDRKAYERGANRPQEMKPGESHVFEIGTDGYTFDLLGESGAKPLRFSVAVLRGGKVIAGPHVALLPPLDGLPSYEQAMFGGGAKATKLTFSR